MKYIALLLISVSLLSCRKRLDSFLFNGSKIESYQLDNYTGEVSLELNGQFDVPDSMINLVHFPVNIDGETVQVQGIYVGDTNQISQDTVILYCHGNKDHMDFYWCREKLYANIGGLGRYGVLMFDYPGFGLSEGTATENNMYASTSSAISWLKDRGLTNDRFVMFGFSLGSAPVCEIAGHTSDYALQPNKIILEAPFASAEIMIQDAAILSMPGSFLVDLKIDNASEIKKINVPLLWIHGMADSFLSMTNHGQLVFDNKPGAKESALVPGGEHETTPFVMGYQAYINRLAEFIQS
jgi:pimeloyl-ACP methyl ester carboxylesterase